MLRGRILEHFDHMLFPGDRGTYHDVLTVRYAQEDGLGNPRPGSYFWTIYYARDRDPVYIEEAMGSTIISRAWQLRP